MKTIMPDVPDVPERRSDYPAGPLQVATLDPRTIAQEIRREVVVVVFEESDGDKGADGVVECRTAGLHEITQVIGSNHNINKIKFTEKITFLRNLNVENPKVFWVEMRTEEVFVFNIEAIYYLQSRDGKIREMKTSDYEQICKYRTLNSDETFDFERAKKIVKEIVKKEEPSLAHLFKKNG